MYCIDCHDGDGEEYPLRVHDAAIEPYEVDVHLCDTCAVEFLAFDWIEDRSREASDD